MSKLPFPLLCVAVATSAYAVEQNFSPKITTKNESKHILFLKATRKTGELFFSVERHSKDIDLETLLTLCLIPVNKGFDPAQAKKNFDLINAPLTTNAVRTLPMIPWCIIDPNKQWLEGSWSEAPSGPEPFFISRTSPLMSMKDMQAAKSQQKDIVVTIADGRTQLFTGTVELVTRRGFFGSAYYNIQQFFRSPFGRRTS